MYPNYSIFDITDGAKTFGKNIMAECLKIRDEIINDPIRKDVWSAQNNDGHPYRIIGSENIGLFTYSIHRITNDKLIECMEDFFEDQGVITDIVIARTMSVVLTDGRTIGVITEDGEVHQLVHVSISEYTVKVENKEGREEEKYFVDYYFSKLDSDIHDQTDTEGLSIEIARHATLASKDALVLGEQTDYLLDFDPQPVEYDMSLIERIHVPSEYTTDYTQYDPVAEAMGIPSDRMDIAFSAPDVCLMFLSNSDFKAPVKATIH